MVKRRRGCPVGSDSSEEESFQTRKMFKSIRFKTKNHNLSEFGRVDEEINSDSSTVVCSRKRRLNNPISSSDDSSSDEIFKKCKRRSLKALSDYDTGDNSSGEGCSGISTSVKKTGRAKKVVVPSKSNPDYLSDSSSDFNITRAGRKKHYNIISSSDSSDSGMPVLIKRKSMRMRIDSSSSESSGFDIPNCRLPRRTNQFQRSSHHRQQSNVSNRQSQTASNRPNGRTLLNVNNDSFTSPTQPESSRINGQMGRPSISRSRRSVSGIRNNSHNAVRPSQSTVNNTRSRTSFRPRTRSQNNSRARTNQEGYRENRWTVTRSTARSTLSTQIIDDDLSNDRSMIARNLHRSVTSSSSSSSMSSSSDTLSSSESEDEIRPVQIRTRRSYMGVHMHLGDDDSNNVPSNFVPEANNIQGAASNSVPVGDSTCKQNDQENLSDSDSESAKCAICFSSFKRQEIASPEACSHFFCLICLQEWAKNSNTCPVDRKVFNSIIVRNEVNGEPIRQVPVPAPTNRTFWEEDIWTTILTSVQINFPSEDNESELSFIINPEDPEERCIICSMTHNSHQMITCDFCYNVFHMTCVNPPLQDIPVDEWYCENCLENEMFSSPDSDSSF